MAIPAHRQYPTTPYSYQEGTPILTCPFRAILWGQRGSNPRPADYESAALTD